MRADCARDCACLEVRVLRSAVSGIARSFLYLRACCGVRAFALALQAWRAFAAPCAPIAAGSVVRAPIANPSNPHYACPMAITQTVEVLADRWITLEVPREVPTGPVVLTFTPAGAAKKAAMTEDEERELFRLHADELNREALGVLSYQDLEP